MNAFAKGWAVELLGWIGIVVIVLVLTLFAIYVLLGPVARRLNKSADSQQAGGLTGTRAMLLQVSAVVTVGITLIGTLGTLFYGYKTVDLSADGQTLDRYLKGIEQLSSSNSGVRVSGVYLLESVARDNPELAWRVTTALSSFLQERARGAYTRRPHLTVQAALEVLGRRDRDHDQGVVTTGPISADGVKLSKSDFSGMDLRGADFSDAILHQVNFAGADLREAKFAGADLTGTQFKSAKMQGAVFARPMAPVKYTRQIRRPRPLLGIQLHGMWEFYWKANQPVALPALGRHLDQIQKLGFNVIRVDIGWSASQPRAGVLNPESVYNKRFRLLLEAASERGLKTLVTIHQTPSWARTGTRAKVFPARPESIRPWAAWMARTYGDRVMAWEVWNEPNISAFTGVDCADPPGPARCRRERAQLYVAVLKEASTGILEGRPGATVVFGGPAQTDVDFIREAYKAGAKPYFHVMAVHPYQDDQRKDPASTDKYDKGRMTYHPELIKEMRANGDGDKPVWWTEFGFSTQEVAPDVAGRHLVSAFTLARERYPEVKLGVVYTARREIAGDGAREQGYNLLTADGEATPQLAAFTEAMR